MWRSVEGRSVSIMLNGLVSIFTANGIRMPFFSHAYKSNGTHIYFLTRGISTTIGMNL